MIITKTPNQITALTPPNVGANIRKARVAVGLSQRDLANLIGLQSATALSYYESGQRTVDAVTLWYIAAVCRVKVADLYA